MDIRVGRLGGRGRLLAKAWKGRMPVVLKGSFEGDVDWSFRGGGGIVAVGVAPSSSSSSARIMCACQSCSNVLGLLFCRISASRVIRSTIASSVWSTLIRDTGGRSLFATCAARFSTFLVAVARARACGEGAREVSTSPMYESSVMIEGVVLAGRPRREGWLLGENITFRIWRKSVGSML